MLPKRIAIKTMGVWTLLVVLATMVWQVSPASAGFTPTPTATTTATATAVPPTATATAVPPTATATATAVPPTATATVGLPTATATTGLPTTTPTLAPTQPALSTPENTPEMPVTGGQASGLSNGMGTVLLLGVAALLIVITILVTRQVDKTKKKV